MSKTEIQRTIMELEVLLRRLRRALVEGDGYPGRVITVQPESVSAIPDWP